MTTIQDFNHLPCVTLLVLNLFDMTTIQDSQNGLVIGNEVLNLFDMTTIQDIVFIRNS